MKLLERITVEPDKCGGRPYIRGLRIRVTDISAMLAEGVSEKEKRFPHFEPAALTAEITAPGRLCARVDCCVVSLASSD